jgi:hypothetical protein
MNEGRWDERLKVRVFVYYESIKRELKIKPIYECRCDERLQTNKTKRFTRLSYTWLVIVTLSNGLFVYLQLNKKKAKAEW